MTPIACERYWLPNLANAALLIAVLACSSCSDDGGTSNPDAGVDAANTDGGDGGVDSRPDGLDDVDPTADSDGDGLTDLAELAEHGTSPILADTDGDGFSDFEEIVELGFDPERNPLRFNPLVSDIPVVQIEVTSPPLVSITCTEGTERTRSFSTDRSQEASNTITNSSSGSTTQTLEFGVTLGSHASLLDFGVSYDVSASESNSTTLGWSQESSQTNSRTYSESRSYAESENETCTGGELVTSVRVTNVGDIAFTLRNLALSASIHDRRNPWQPTPVGNLLFDSAGSGIAEFPATTLGPGQQIAQLVFKNTALNLRTLEAVLRDAANLVVEPGSRELTDANDQSFVHSATSIQATTATLILDYGVLGTPQERYHVATNTRPDAFGVSAGHVLRAYLGLVADDPDGYVLGTTPWDYDRDGSAEGSTESGVTAIRGVATDSALNSYWVVAHTVDDGVRQTTTVFNPLSEAFDLDSFELRAGDVLHLAYIQDVDGDGLAARNEFLYGTDPDVADTDGDGLSDGEEILGWDVSIRGVQTRVHSNPLVVDTDGDGQDDLTERDAGTHPGASGEPVIRELLVENVEGFEFTVSVSALVEDADGTVEAIEVDWGDETPVDVETGTSLAGLTDLEHTYAEPGLYTISVSARDDQGNETPEPARRDVAVPLGMLAFYRFEGDDLDSGPYQAHAVFSGEAYRADRHDTPEAAADLVAGEAVPQTVDGASTFSFPQIIAPHLDFSDSFTLAGWFYHFNAHGQDDRVLGQGNWFSIYVEDGHLAFGVLDERDPTGPRARNPDEQASSAWTFAAGVVSYDGTDSTIILYVDGEEVHRTTVADTRYENPGVCNFYGGAALTWLRQDPAGTVVVPGDPPEVLVVEFDAGSECEAIYAHTNFPGFIDDLRVYDRALSADDIAALYQE